MIPEALTQLDEEPVTLEEKIAHLAHHASYEVNARDLAGFGEAGALLAPGTRLTISWLPKDDDEDRIAMARAVTEAGCESMMHIAARRIPSADALDRLLGRLADETGTRAAFVVGGDPERAEGPYASGHDAIASGLFARHGFTTIGLPGYPEGHTAISDEALDADRRAKLALVRDAGMMPLLMTQFAFESEPILEWLERVRAEEPDLRIRIGLAGPASIKTLLRYAAICGLGASARGIGKLGGSIARMLQETGPDPIIRACAERYDRFYAGPTRLHFFPFGGFAKTARWVRTLADGRFTAPPGKPGLRIDR
ncbi:MAG: methylenetetrahydrofolate reductase [Sphingomonadaceae bacterium]|nr:methylenetetrahydrofolate reductase [Sphingomonadaceae bacterium]